MEKFENFSHRHYLTLDQKERKEGDQMTCYGCTNKIWSDFYGCTHCKHYICKSCFGLPPEMLHPFHKEHPLTLLAESPYKEASASPYCHACRVKCEGFIFHCSECKFDLDVNCATLLMPTTNNNKASEQQTHPHALIPCYTKYKQIEFLCCVSKQSINGTIYVCLSCRAIVDESCSQLPQQITHHIHPRRTLTLTNYGVKYFKSCKACGVSKNRFCYTCSGCSECFGRFKFHLDVRCASLIPKNQLQEEVVVQAPASFTHPHGLIPCDSKGFFNFSCSAC
ncbi:protein VACUOLELESS GAMETOPHYTES-like [Cornus florida]|uniref:protein VACUOLELESS GAMETOPHYTES-like n=1 Tax=Cornus florida TaxID=4283 RepID=UPI0028A28BFF|nr:protein VACUOLELESS GAMETOPHYTES-like [Cornus florida]